MFQVDYIKYLSIVAVTEEMGFEKMIGLRVYALEEGTVAEICVFHIQAMAAPGNRQCIFGKNHRGLPGKRLTGLFAYTHSNNAGMVKLFNRLPDKVETILKGGMLVLKWNFEEAL